MDEGGRGGGGGQGIGRGGGHLLTARSNPNPNPLEGSVRQHHVCNMSSVMVGGNIAGLSHKCPGGQRVALGHVALGLAEQRSGPLGDGANNGWGLRA